MHHRLIAGFTFAAAVLCASGASAALVTNGGFEADPMGAATPPGWTVTGHGISIDQAFPNQGNRDVAFAALSTDPNPGILSQTIGTSPGQRYVLRFALLDQAGFSGDTFLVRFGGFSTTIKGDTVAPPGNLPSFYRSESFDISAANVTASGTDLLFQAASAPGLGIVFNLDDVSLEPVGTPEPTSAFLLGSALLALSALGLRQGANRRHTGTVNLSDCGRDGAR